MDNLEIEFDVLADGTQHVSTAPQVLDLQLALVGGGVGDVVLD